MDLLRRRQSPLAQESWDLIDEQAREVLRGNLSARQIVDVDGPHGIEYAAVNLGRLDPGQVDAGGGVLYGIRKVQPLVEVRVPFTLDLWELDNVARGAKDPDLDPLVAAAKKIAAFEDRAIYFGFAPGGITGMAEASSHEAISLGEAPGVFAQRVAKGMVAMKEAGELGPYTLVVGPRLFQRLESDGAGYPPRKEIESLIQGKVILSPVLDKEVSGILVPTDSEDDFQLTLGQDLAVGYLSQDSKTVHLYLTESFSFRVIEPQAVVVFKGA